GHGRLRRDHRRPPRRAGHGGAPGEPQPPALGERDGPHQAAPRDRRRRREVQPRHHGRLARRAVALLHARPRHPRGDGTRDAHGGLPPRPGRHDPGRAGARGAPRARRGRGGAMSFDVAALRAQFPALEQRVNGRPLVYLDSAATALKPRRVIEAVESVYAADCANIHRAVHALSQRATARYEGARDVAVRFLNAKSRAEVVYTRGTTEGINLVAQTWGLEHLREGDEI